MYRKISCVNILMLCFSLSSSVQAEEFRVKVGGTGNGASWANACSMSYAIANANFPTNKNDEIWMQAGTYAPITLTNGVKYYGGFAGTETLASQSDPATNVTIIDGGTTAIAVTSNSNASSTILRGFRITNGKNTDFGGGGGGLYLNNSSTLIIQCVFDNNKAIWFGAAVYIRGAGSPQFINCIFHDNGDTSLIMPLGGGAVMVHSGSPSFSNCLFYNNYGGEGGAIALDSGIPTLINCTIVNNHAVKGNGGGIYDMMGNAIIKNCILWNNDATASGAQIMNRKRAKSSVINSDVQGGWTGTGNINSDPLFTNVASNDYTLQDTSPCKDKGNKLDLPLDVGDLDWDNNVTEKLQLDLEMKMRISYFKVEMGAYETPFIPPNPN